MSETDDRDELERMADELVAHDAERMAAERANAADGHDAPGVNDAGDRAGTPAADAAAPADAPAMPAATPGGDADPDPTAGPRDDATPADDLQAALDALVNEDTIAEVDAPSPESLAGPSPVLEDIPDAAPIAPAPAPTQAATTATDADAGRADQTAASADGDAGTPGAGEAQAAAQADHLDGGDVPGGATASPGADTTPTPQPDDDVERAAMDVANASPSQTLPFAPVVPTVPASRPSDSSRIAGSARSTGALAWGSRTDVGRIREHNEDSYLINFPLFAVADGMGGHAAGEVASTIAISSLAECGITKADPYALGAAVEQANREVIAGAQRGMGRAGMGTTCTAVVIEGNRMAVGHVGDSRAYLLHGGKLLRVTHDHSFVEELVEAGEITPEEARVHPNRSVITRALGNDPNMRADAFTVDVTAGDRVLLCSDGLSSMITDAAIEEIMVSSPKPQGCADRLVDQALDAGGLDNVTVIVIDVTDDGIERHALRNRFRNVSIWIGVVVLVLALICGGVGLYATNTWYLSDANGYVALNRGVPGTLGPIDLSRQVELTNIRVADLSQAVEVRLSQGISFRSEDDARAVLEQYRRAIADRRSADGSAVETAAADGVVSDVARSADNPGGSAAANLPGLRAASSAGDASAPRDGASSQG